MLPYFDCRLTLYKLFLALFLTTTTLIGRLLADQTHAGIKFEPFHVSWTSKDTRFDFVFTLNGTIKGPINLETDPSNYLKSSLLNCTNNSACLIKNGTLLESFQISNTSQQHQSIFNHAEQTTASKSNPRSSPLDDCDNGNTIKIVHYCSTHWNPPSYLVRTDCSHLIEWHSPLTCSANATNHERPCHIYSPEGKLIDLTPWIISNGSSHKVETGDTSVKQFNLNICNEAHEPCGPNVAACYVDQRSDIVESGYSNLTSIKYDARNQTVLLTYLGHYEARCPGQRIKTVVRFICKNRIISNSRPKLIKSEDCENTIEWPSIHACPIVETRAPALGCNIKYEPMGIDIDIRKLTNNQTQVVVPNIKLDGKDKTMVLGICKGLSKNYACGGKQNSNTKACLIDAHDTSAVRTADNSMIVGSLSNSFIRLSDDKIYLETRAINQTCSETVRKDFNITQQIGTRIEFFCSPSYQSKPTFLGYDDCTYVFEWGSPLVCLESLQNSAPIVPSKSTDIPKKPGDKPIDNIKDETKEEKQEPKIVYETTGKHKTEQQAKPSMQQTSSHKRPKTNGLHAFFMISGIFLMFSAFIVVILVLDKKTRLRVTLRQARQAFQSSNRQPYSRVIDDLDL